LRERKSFGHDRKRSDVWIDTNRGKHVATEVDRAFIILMVVV
jgi:hypothetical protein